MRKIILCFISIFIVFSFGKLFSNVNNCVFDPEAINKAFFLKTTKFKDAIWNDSNKEAKIIKSNDETITVKYYSCNHFGMKADYYIKIFKENISYDFIKEKALWLGNQTLDEFDYSLLSRRLIEYKENGEINNLKNNKNVFIIIKGSKYAEFLVWISFEDINEIIISISYYMI